MSICIYGTVFNNYNRVEESIKSIFRSNYNIVIVDSYSKDGTWEKLQELKKEYNLSLYRLKSTRGKGRDYALRQCPENSLTAYFDLDTVYNENFHRALELEIPFVYTGTYIAKREYLIEVGGWKDLNAGEDYELLSRVRIDMFLPVIIGYNEKVNFFRERRYARNPFKYLIRRFKNGVDFVRGYGYNRLDEYVRNRYHGIKYIPFQIIMYTTAKMMGIYRNCESWSHDVCVTLKYLKALKDPEDYGFPKDDILLGIYMRYIYPLKDLSIKLPFPIVRFYNGFIFNAKTEEAIIKHLKTPLPR